MKPYAGIVAVTLALSGCGDSESAGDPAAACAAAEIYVSAYDEMDAYKGTDTDRIGRMLREAVYASEDAYFTMIETTPGDVKKALQAIYSYDADTATSGEQAEYAEARMAATDWIRGECDIAYEF